MAVWKAQRTLLIVGEGYHEVAFLTHVKQLYVQRGCGLAVTIKNARGKGAMHVIDCAIKQSANAAYDTVAAMLDTDTDWSADVKRQAKEKGILVMASESCFDEVMLRLLGQSTKGNAKALKKRLAPYVKDDATISQNYAKHFGKDCLEAGRGKESTVDDLLRLFGA